MPKSFIFTPMKIIMLAILFILSVCTSAFSQDTANAEAIRYYKFLTKEGIEVSQNLSRLGNYLTEYSGISKKCNGLDEERFDTINNLFHETALEVNNGIFAILTLKEFDSAVSLKDPVLKLFYGYNKILSDYFPVFLAALKSGGKDLNEEQIAGLRNTYKNLIAYLQEMNKQTEVIDTISAQFKTKYHFTEYDVMKNGL